MSSRALDVDRYLVAAAVVLTCVLFTPSTFDPVNVVKLTALLLVTVALLVTTTVRVLRDRVLSLPVSAGGVVALALAVALVVATLTAPVTNTAVLGAYGRNSGLLAYLGAIVLFVVGLRVFDRPGARVLVGGVVAAGLFTATYGLLQKAGYDSIPWNNPFNPVIAALGNPNFASGYLGIAASVGAGGALWRGWAAGWRAACGLTALLCLITAALSSSVQGPIAAAGGLSVVGLAWMLNQSGTRLKVGLTVVSTGIVLAVAGLLAGAIAKVGPAAGIFSDNGSKARVYYWDAALAMFSDKPLLGVGLDQYGNFWRSERSTASVDFLGGPSYSDAAHSVPLQMLAQGGSVLGLAYAAFLVVTGVALIRGLVRLRGDDRMLLAAVGGGWLAYQVQSFVSIDQVPLIVLHFALAGGVIAASGSSGLRKFRLPGALVPVPVHPNDARAKRRAAVAAPRRRSLSGADAVVLSVVGVVALFAAYQSFDPLRANRAVKAAADALGTGDGTTALAQYEKARDLVPGQAYYAILEGNLFQTVEPRRPALAAASYERAVEVDPYEVNAIKAAAALAEERGDLEQARNFYRRAAELDPYNDETLEPVAQFELRHGGADDALRLLESARERLPRSARVLASLGDARAVLGDDSGAREAYDAALALDPAQPIATAGIAKLAAAGA
ncbi:MAG: hypothetical protein JWN08_2832 [Frankiales bacterium]|nr:hypothetical protein [Frankiales bacterium]